MDKFLNLVANSVRRAMKWPALVIDKFSGGKVTPNHITLISLLGHVGVLWALWTLHPIVAGLLLIVFGLMDSLDGALAKIQNRTSIVGMFYDASSDRLKEVILYIGIVHLFTDGYAGYGLAWLPTTVLGGSLFVSYLKAKGEMALASHAKYKPQELNRIFTDGIARYEVRMAFIVGGLFSSLLAEVLFILLGLLAITALQRTIRISRALKNV